MFFALTSSQSASAIKKPLTGKFSLGMKQRLGIGIALLGDPEFLILDEPVNGLDSTGIKEIRDVILRLNHERGITLLISSHLLDELSKMISVLRDGEVPLLTSIF